ncbi:protein O-linked-mannose beta-1,4-N-acetylglucosaminyltransferase 2-like [Canna indica]|uniref:Protein O-linked-mannose beta-1,4-N-acetylglucosaminyltransferase 2-like n=1 Tax=Canna indica TaxID=4628 RepID=A0AAQ3JPG1_9LILI|nr:protein O-linked-mannose beta-1,4-N-acetylglucosaminyltransferase 2-like [Canna indica]
MCSSTRSTTMNVLGMRNHELSLFCKLLPYIASYEEVALWINLSKVSPITLILKQLSNYDIIDANNDDQVAVRCFPHVLVGLSFHKELDVDPARAPMVYSMIDFKEMLRKAYGLERATTAPTCDTSDIRRKPTLLIISRKKTRVFLNERGMTDMAMSLGFNMCVAEPDITTDLRGQALMLVPTVKFHFLWGQALLLQAKG